MYEPLALLVRLRVRLFSRAVYEQGMPVRYEVLPPPHGRNLKGGGSTFFVSSSEPETYKVLPSTVAWHGQQLMGVIHPVEIQHRPSHKKPEIRC